MFILVLCRDTRPVSSQFSCLVPWFPDRDWVRRKWKGRKSLNLCIIWLKVPANVKKLKKLELKSQFWELLLHYQSSFSLFWAVLRCLESCLDPSRFFKPSLDLSRPAKNLSRLNTSLDKHSLTHCFQQLSVHTQPGTLAHLVRTVKLISHTKIKNNTVVSMLRM